MLKPLDLRRLSDRELVLRMADENKDFRWAAFQELCARGEKRGWEAYGLATQDPELARLFVSPKDPFDAVGAVVGPSTYDRIRSAWPDAVEQKIDNNGRELTIDFRHRRLDVVCLGETPWPVQGETPESPEGLGEVEFCVTDVSAFAARVGQLKGDLRARLILLPGPSMAGLPTRFLLAHIRVPRGAQTVLVQLIQG